MKLEMKRLPLFEERLHSERCEKEKRYDVNDQVEQGLKQCRLWRVINNDYCFKMKELF